MQPLFVEKYTDINYNATSFLYMYLVQNIANVAKRGGSDTSVLYIMYMRCYIIKIIFIFIDN